MSSSPRDRGEMPGDEAIERALRGVPRPAARPEFKERLRAEFLAAAAAQSTDTANAGNRAEAEMPGASAAPSRSDVELSPPETGRRSRFSLVPLFVMAAAASIIAAFIFLRRDDTRAWRVLGVEGTGTVLVDGVAIDVANTDKIAELLLSAREFDSRDARIRLTMRDQVVFELDRNTRLSEMSFPAAGLYSVRADVGSLAVCTGPKFHGERMKVVSKDIDVEVVGTAFSVDVEESGTCVCCLEGRIAARPRPMEKPQAIDAGQMCFAFAAQKPAMWGGAMDKHLHAPRDLAAWVGANWK